MKKKLLVITLFLTFFTSVFSWIVVDQVDEFKDKTGGVAIGQSSKNNKDLLIIVKDSGKYSIMFITKEYIGGKGKLRSSEVKLKLDSGKIITLNGTVDFSNPSIVIISSSLYVTPQQEINNLIDEMKEHQNLKVVIENYKGGNTFTEFDITDLKSYILEVRGEGVNF